MSNYIKSAIDMVALAGHRHLAHRAAAELQALLAKAEADRAYLSRYRDAYRPGDEGDMPNGVGQPGAPYPD